MTGQKYVTTLTAILQVNLGEQFPTVLFFHLDWNKTFGDKQHSFLQVGCLSRHPNNGVDWVVILCHTQNKIGHFRDVPQANLLAWYGKTKPNTTKAHIHQPKEMYYNTK